MGHQSSFAKKKWAAVQWSVIVQSAHQFSIDSAVQFSETDCYQQCTLCIRVKKKGRRWRDMAQTRQRWRGTWERMLDGDHHHDSRVWRLGENEYNGWMVLLEALMRALRRRGLGCRRSVNPPFETLPYQPPQSWLLFSLAHHLSVPSVAYSTAHHPLR